MRGASVAALPPHFNHEDDDQLELNIDGDNAPTKRLLPDKPRWSRPAKTAMAFFVFVALGALSLTTEMQALPRWASFDPRCSPATLDVGSVNYRSDHRFYAMIKDMKALSAPVFRGEHEALCSDEKSEDRKFAYCLPITSQDDPVFCAGADRIDLLVRQSPLTLCRASVMHMLLTDVYEELQAVGAYPSVNFSSTDETTQEQDDESVAAAMLNAGVSSVVYRGDISRGCALDVALRQKGYHLFQDNGAWRACVAPTHPLASHLYDPDRKMSTSGNAVLHIDLVVGSGNQQVSSVVIPDKIKAHPRIDDTCTPNVLDAKTIEYGSKHRFYMVLQTMETLPAPVFHSEHKVLCNENVSDEDKLPYCLPISTRCDVEFCTDADRIDLLVRQSPSTLCLTSVLDLLAADVLEELRMAEASPIVNLNKDHSLEGLAETTNITYRGELVSVDKLKLSLLRKGYHLYYAGTWRVCVAPIHPLAANLYNPEQPALEVYAGPYLTLVPDKQGGVSTEAPMDKAEATRMNDEDPEVTEAPNTIEAPSTNEDAPEESETPSTIEDTPEETESPPIQETEASTIPETGCKPDVVDVVDDGSGGEFYSMMKSSGPLPAPRFIGENEILCNANNRKHRAFRYCLPISGRKDSSLCANADRMDIFLRQSPAKQCFASVLHMLLKDVYEELKAVGFVPILTFGTLLGAVRDGGIIPFTEDVDIAYNGQIVDGGELDDRLWRKGYHLFDYNIWRVCVAPTHPLASQLYDPDHPIVQDYAVPYVDLYSMQQQFGTSWTMQELKVRRLPNDRVEPFAQVPINGEQFDTIHDPDFLLLSEYGADYMTPKPRDRRLAWEDYR